MNSSVERNLQRSSSPTADEISRTVCSFQNIDTTDIFSGLTMLSSTSSVLLPIHNDINITFLDMMKEILEFL